MEKRRRGSRDAVTRHSGLGDPAIFQNVQIAVMESNNWQLLHKAKCDAERNFIKHIHAVQKLNHG